MLRMVRFALAGSEACMWVIYANVFDVLNDYTFDVA